MSPFGNRTASRQKFRCGSIARSRSGCWGKTCANSARHSCSTSPLMSIKSTTGPWPEVRKFSPGSTRSGSWRTTPVGAPACLGAGRIADGAELLDQLRLQRGRGIGFEWGVGRRMGGGLRLSSGGLRPFAARESARSQSEADAKEAARGAESHRRRLAGDIELFHREIGAIARGAPSCSQADRSATEPAASKDAGLPLPSRSAQPECCVDQLH